MSTHDVLSVADHLGLSQGWLHAEGSHPQLDRVRASRPVRVDLQGLLADRRVVMTDGLASGSLRFAAVEEAAAPPSDRALPTWADEKGRPWVEVVDNEQAYWGGLGDAQIDVLVAWFLAQRPLAEDWRQLGMVGTAAQRLRHGLFSHGWLRNAALVVAGRKPSTDLWGGIHSGCLLDHNGMLVPSTVSAGVRVQRGSDGWQLSDLSMRCPLADDTGKMAR